MMDVFRVYATARRSKVSNLMLDKLKNFLQHINVSAQPLMSKLRRLKNKYNNFKLKRQIKLISIYSKVNKKSLAVNLVCQD